MESRFGSSVSQIQPLHPLMTKKTAHPALENNQSRFRGSLTGTLVRTLLVFTFIPLLLMAGSAYLHARNLLREQAVTQLENLLSNQLLVIDREIKIREGSLEERVAAGDMWEVIETTLQTSPDSPAFQESRSQFVAQIQGNEPFFDHVLLVDNEGSIKVASNPEWENQTIASSKFDIRGTQSLALYGFSPLYDDEFILVTAVEYISSNGSKSGTVLGITEQEGLRQLVQPLNALAPYANTVFILSDKKLIASNPETGEFNLVNSASASQADMIASLEAMMASEQPASIVLDVTTPSGESALAQLQYFPGMRSGVALEIRAQDVYNQINSLAPFTIILVLGALIATGAALALGSRRVIKPIRTLADITRKFADGDWRQRASVKSDDEVGQLASSFNQLADQISEIQQSLEKKVDERARQLRTAAEVAQSITTIPNLDEMLNKTAELLVQQFGYYQASIFMVDRGGKYAEFKAGYGPATKGLSDKKYRLEVGSASIIGWVAAKNQPRITTDVSEDPIHLKNEFLPETRSEASLPISLGNLVLGVLDVQSTSPGEFSADAIVMLQTLASQIAAAIQTGMLIESSHVDFHELERLYRSSHLIAEAKNEAEILRVSGQILRNAPYPIIMFQAKNDMLEVFTSADLTRDGEALYGFPSQIQISADAINDFLPREVSTVLLSDTGIPKPFRDIMNNLDLVGAVFLPIRKREVLTALIMLGTRQRIFTNASIQPYASLADLISISLERADAVEQTEKHLLEVEALASINELTSSAPDIQSFFHALLAKIRQIIGDYNLTVALYDQTSNSISIPFNYENGRVGTITSFPLGEGLTSILIRTRQPLMLVENTEKRAEELGAKIAGKPARSWMGVPMLVQNQPIGALIIQDLNNEGAFDEDDLKFFTTITGQVAGVINNIRLLDESQRKAIQLETAAEIARDISGSLNLDELLSKAVNLIRERFDFYHASIFLLDLPGEFAVIREATGEAGAQMKRAGYKMGVGSKSIVGFVSGRGEQLTVNDTSKDATYYANPLLPDTRSEAAIPLRVGDRILGVLDVQSTKPFAFSEDNLRSLQILADQLAVAVANTELFAETQEHLSQHRLLHHITSTAASGSTLEEALESAVNGLQVTLGGDRVTVLLVDRDKKALQVKASIGYAEDTTSFEVEIGKGITGWVAAHRRPLRVRDVNDDPRYIPLSTNTRSELAIPLVYRSELLGVLNVESEQADAYSDNDEEMLGTLGGSLAAIIANARLLEQIRTQSERERVIYDATSKIRRSTDIQSILMTTASEITRITGARYTKIGLRTGDDQEKKDLS